MQEMGIASNRNASCKDYKAARARYKAKLRDKAARFTEDAPNKLWVCDVSEVLRGAQAEPRSRLSYGSQLAQHLATVLRLPAQASGDDVAFASACPD